jgi:hypothetical protein
MGAYERCGVNPMVDQGLKRAYENNGKENKGA